MAALTIVAAAAQRLAAGTTTNSRSCGGSSIHGCAPSPRRPQRQRAGVLAGARGAPSGRKGGRAAAPPPAQVPSEAADDLAEERQVAADAAAVLSEQQQQKLDAIAAAISAKLDALADSDDWTPGGHPPVGFLGISLSASPGRLAAAGERCQACRQLPAGR